jgi:hypothetical protein
MSSTATDNLVKFYSSLFIGLQLALSEAIILYIYDYQNHSINVVYIIIVLLIFTIYYGYKLKSLDFLDSKQYLLTLIDQNDTTLLYSEARMNRDPTLRKYAENMISIREKEIRDMGKLLKKYA